MIDYTQILIVNYPNTQWNLDGNSYDGLTWLSNTQKPTQAELDALWESTQAAVAAKVQAAKDVKASALAKLAALGLTQDEIKALVG
jgi:uncharacterized protein YhjY with autotransporter beta-barrel domain